MKSSRQIAFDLLLNTEKNGAYSSIALDAALKESGFDAVNKRFCTALFYGVLERKITLDYIISRYVKKGVTSLDDEIKIILRMAVYQILYMDSIPDSAAVNEGVKLASYAKKKSASGLVNGVLRNFLREGKKFDIKTDDKFLYNSILYSIPVWILKLIANQYDFETAIEYAKSALLRPAVYARVNTLKITTDELITKLSKSGVKAKKTEIDNCIELFDTGSIESLKEFKDGLFFIQDKASQLCALALDAKAHERIIDMCAAPGSKTVLIAQCMENKGEIEAFDLYPHKIKLIEQNTKKANVDIVKAGVKDSSVYDKSIKLADRVLCDVPCSGLGIIRRKPEIKYKDKESIESLPDIQYKILKNASRYVKKQGILLYSTCTVNKKENEEVTARFLNENKEFRPLQLPSSLSIIKNKSLSEVTLINDSNGCDGFYIALFKRCGDSNG